MPKTQRHRRLAEGVGVEVAHLKALMVWRAAVHGEARILLRGASAGVYRWRVLLDFSEAARVYSPCGRAGEEPCCRFRWVLRLCRSPSAG